MPAAPRRPSSASSSPPSVVDHAFPAPSPGAPETIRPSAKARTRARSSFRPAATASMNCAWTSSSIACSTRRSSGVIARAKLPMSPELPSLHDDEVDTDLLQESVHVGQPHDDADRAGERAGAGVDLVGGDRRVVAARGGHRAERGDHGLARLAQPGEGRVQLLGGPTTPRAVDPDHHRLDRSGCRDGP